MSHHRIASLLLAAATVGCAPAIAANVTAEVPVAVAVPLHSRATAVTVEVSGVDLPVPLHRHLRVEHGMAEGTLVVPAGVGRTFSVRVADAHGLVTHAGAVTRDVGQGPEGVSRLTLRGRHGMAPVELAVGSASEGALAAAGAGHAKR
jgi:hypothetical protein